MRTDTGGASPVSTAAARTGGASNTGAVAPSQGENRPFETAGAANAPAVSLSQRITQRAPRVGPAAEDPRRRPVSFVEAVVLGGDRWMDLLSNRHVAVCMSRDTKRDADRMRQMWRNSIEHKDWNVASYCAHVLPVLTGHFPFATASASTVQP